ncbi:protein-disulfide isomerase [Corynebacterium mustelae]|uniref:Protein-disulfide isomerase n=1 Tax=Corynebacterium mustelae TaxID=571915 RepID=A0A0G3H263_9CORY|nr:thioredoxin domain-containing protein [Corynebacterium mustelae]AKK06840.1 protein-disulfide isomerase [Corynebacterium mustelae]
MSTKIKNPNEKGSGFIWAVIVLLTLAAILIGYVVVSGKNAKEEELAQRATETVAFETSYEDNGITLKAANAKANAKKVDLYEDYSCSYCSQLAKSTDADMKKAIEDGEVVVTIWSLNFLDRGKIGHSTNAGAAAYVIAKNEPANVYWNYRKILMEDQEDIYGSWDTDDFVSAARAVGASEETLNHITSGTFIEEYQKLAKQNADKLEKETGTVSSPRVIVDGTEIQGESVFDWVNEVVRK